MSDRISSEHREKSRFERWPAIAGLTYGLVGAPLSALIMQSVAYNGVQWACGHQSIAEVHIVPAIFILLALASVWITWRDWGRVGRTGRAETATITDRTRFVAVAGLAVSIFSVIMILGMWLPLLAFDPCQH